MAGVQLSPRMFEEPSDAPLRSVQIAQSTIRCDARMLRCLAGEAQDGYLRKPWGGVEVGGILLGTVEDGETIIRDRVVFESEHAFGPAFELSEKDRESFTALLDSLRHAGEELTVAGWYRTTSKELSLTAEDIALSTAFFNDSGQSVLVIQRGRQQAPKFCLFQKPAGGNWTAGDEFTLDQESAPEAAIPKAVETAAPVTAPKDPQIEPAIAEVQTAVEAGASEIPAEVLEPEPPLATAAATLVDRSIAEEPPAPISAPQNYCEFFGFCEEPFSLAPDPRFWYPGAAHREAVAALLYGIQMRKGFLVLTGEPGTGKTMALECLRDKLDGAGVEFASVTNSRVRPDEFLELVAFDLALDCESARKTQLWIALQQHVLAVAGEGRTTAILVDDAHKLAPEVLEEIELLGNFATRCGSLLQVVLAGTSALEQKLERTELRGLRQRIALRAKVSGLSQEDTIAYIQTRLERAGAPENNAVPEPVAREIWARTGGVPRLINGLLLRMFELAFEQGWKTLTPDVLELAAGEMVLCR